jgi:predicted nucleotidyltransferase
MRIVTVRERKERETRRREDAAAGVAARLREHVEKSGHIGRFIVFGSAAAGGMRHHSDIDIIIDFPAGQEAHAWTAAEDACAEWDIPADIMSIHTTKDAFVQKVLSRLHEIID